MFEDTQEGADTQFGGRPLPVFRIGPSNGGSFLHRKVVNGGNPFFTPFQANVEGINLPDVQPLRSAPNQ